MNSDLSVFDFLSLQRTFNIYKNSWDELAFLQEELLKTKGITYLINDFKTLPNWLTFDKSNNELSFYPVCYSRFIMNTDSLDLKVLGFARFFEGNDIWKIQIGVHSKNFKYRKNVEVQSFNNISFPLQIKLSIVQKHRSAKEFLLRQNYDKNAYDLLSETKESSEFDKILFITKDLYFTNHIIHLDDGYWKKIYKGISHVEFIQFRTALISSFLMQDNPILVQYDSINGDFYFLSKPSLPFFKILHYYSYFKLFLPFK